MIVVLLNEAYGGCEKFGDDEDFWEGENGFIAGVLC